jgi:hypothetical protein
MVTHALACCIDIAIVITAAGQLELAGLSLDRQGDDEAILANVQASNNAIEAAVPLCTIEGTPTARLRYGVDRPEAVAEGFRNLRRTLPYLFATCPKLGDVVVEDHERHETWTAGPVLLKREANPYLSARQVKTLASDGTALDEVEVFSCKASARSHATLITLVQGGESAPRFHVPEQGFPRLFARFPVRDTGARPMPVILDAPFDVPQERAIDAAQWFVILVGSKSRATPWQEAEWSAALARSADREKKVLPVVLVAVVKFQYSSRARFQERRRELWREGHARPDPPRRLSRTPSIVSRAVSSSSRFYSSHGRNAC